MKTWATTCESFTNEEATCFTGHGKKKNKKASLEPFSFYLISFKHYEIFLVASPHPANQTDLNEVGILKFIAMSKMKWRENF